MGTDMGRALLPQLKMELNMLEIGLWANTKVKEK